jgi:hypothetical protein
MTSGAMLAGLIGQANAEGASLVTLRALVEEASEAGAQRALARVGLTGESAARDLGELRELLGAWRDAKTAARRAAVGWLVRLALAGLLLWLALLAGMGGAPGR